MGCVTTAKYSVCINGSSVGFFGSKRGLTPGNPLPPLLFIISEEVLSRGLIFKVATGDLIPYKIPRCCSPISHILFADDVLIFSNAGKQNLRKLMAFYTTDKAISCQTVNMAKSSFLLHKSNAM